MRFKKRFLSLFIFSQIFLISLFDSASANPGCGDYPATYSFENDVIYGYPSGWTPFEGGGCTVNVVSEIGGHKNVVELYDNGEGVTNLAYINNTFTDQTTGTIEFWYRRTNPTEWVRWRLWKGNTVVTNMGSEGGTFQYNDGSWQTISICNSDQWYHIRIDFDTNTDTFNLTIDGTQEVTNGAFITNVASINTLQLYTRGWGTKNYRGYYDAVGYSWDPNYNIGDNLQDLCNSNPLDFWWIILIIGVISAIAIIIVVYYKKSQEKPTSKIKDRTSQLSEFKIRRDELIFRGEENIQQNFCPSCGRANKKTDKFCGFCGSRFGE